MASIVDYLKSQGQASDYASRSKLAAEKGITGYTGTAAQNIQLLGILQTSQAAAPTNTPTTSSFADAMQNAGQDFQKTGKQLRADREARRQAKGAVTFSPEVPTETPWDISAASSGARSGPSRAQITAATQKGIEAADKTRSLTDFYNQPSGASPTTLPSPASPESRSPFGKFSTAEDFLKIPSVKEAIDMFKTERPDLDINYSDPILQRLVERELRLSERTGKDPSQKLDQIFAQERFQIPATVPMQPKEPSVAFSDILGGTDAIANDIFNDPEKYGGQSSAMMLLNQLNNIKLPEQQHAETMQFLLDQAKRVETFAVQFKDLTESHAQENQKILDMEKEAAQDRINLEKAKIQAEKDDTMGQLREKQARMEAYLKMKLGSQGLTSSASGLSLLMSKVTAFDQMVVSSGLKYNLALEGLSQQSNELALGFANASIQNKQNAENKIYDIQKMLSDSLADIEGKGIQSAQQSRLDKATTVSKFFEDIQKVESEKKGREIEIWKETNRKNEVALKEANRVAENQAKVAREEIGNFVGDVNSFLEELGLPQTDATRETVAILSQSILDGEMTGQQAYMRYQMAAAANPQVQRYLSQTRQERDLSMAKKQADLARAQRLAGGGGSGGGKFKLTSGDALALVNAGLIPAGGDLPGTVQDLSQEQAETVMQARGKLDPFAALESQIAGQLTNSFTEE